MHTNFKLPEGFKAVLNIRTETGSVFVIENPNFNGFAVTLAFEMVIDELEKGQLEFNLSCKGAACSEDEEFDSQHGLEIAVGRLYLLEKPQQIITATTFSKQFIESCVEDFVSSKIEKMREYTDTKNTMNIHIKNVIAIRNQNLKNLFKDFK